MGVSLISRGAHEYIGGRIWVLMQIFHCRCYKMGHDSTHNKENRLLCDLHAIKTLRPTVAYACWYTLQFHHSQSAKSIVNGETKVRVSILVRLCSYTGRGYVVEGGLIGYQGILTLILLRKVCYLVRSKTLKG